MLKLHGVTKQWTPLGPPVLDHVDLTVARGEVVHLLGPNGAGKSTAFEIISGQARPTAGSVEVDGVDMTPLDAPQRAGLVAHVSQEPLKSLLPEQTVIENILIAADCSGKRLPTAGTGARTRFRAREFLVAALGESRLGPLENSLYSLCRGLSNDHLQRLRQCMAFLERCPLSAAHGPTPEMTVCENLLRSASRSITNVPIFFPRHRMRARIERHLVAAGFAQLAQRLDVHVESLSGGERQALNLYMVSLKHPAVLLLDEPTSALDEGVRDTFLGHVTRLIEDTQAATIIVSHDLEAVLLRATRIVVLGGGKIVRDMRRGDEFWAVEGLLKLFRTPVAGLPGTGLADEAFRERDRHEVLGAQDDQGRGPGGDHRSGRIRAGGELDPVARPLDRVLLLGQVDPTRNPDLERVPALDAAPFTPGPSERLRAADPPPDALTGRRALVEAYRAELARDPHFAPHADLCLEPLGELGRGGMGVVHRVRDRRLGREAAMKVILGSATPRQVQRFLREARITAGLDHPAIPPVHEAGTDAAGRHYLLMRVIRGQSLAELFEALHPRATRGATASETPRELLEALVKVSEAVAYAHSKGVVHRDLKPANVMVGSFGEVVLMDWGVARELARPDESDEGALVGTLGYMPPEQAQGRAVDARADVYALGAVLVELLTGRPPVTGKDALSMIRDTVEGKLQLPRDRRPDVSIELHDLAAHALAADPAARPTAAEFAADMRAYLAGDEVSAHRYGLLERATRAARRHPTLLVGSAGLAFGLARLGRSRGLLLLGVTTAAVVVATPALFLGAGVVLPASALLAAVGLTLVLDQSRRQRELRRALLRYFGRVVVPPEDDAEPRDWLADLPHPIASAWAAARTRPPGPDRTAAFLQAGEVALKTLAAVAIADARRVGSPPALEAFLADCLAKPSLGHFARALREAIRVVAASPLQAAFPALAALYQGDERLRRTLDDVVEWRSCGAQLPAEDTLALGAAFEIELGRLLRRLTTCFLGAPLVRFGSTTQQGGDLQANVNLLMGPAEAHAHALLRVETLPAKENALGLVCLATGRILLLEPLIAMLRCKRHQQDELAFWNGETSGGRPRYLSYARGCAEALVVPERRDHEPSARVGPHLTLLAVCALPIARGDDPPRPEPPLAIVVSHRAEGN